MLANEYVFPTNNYIQCCYVYVLGQNDRGVKTNQVVPSTFRHVFYNITLVNCFQLVFINTEQTSKQSVG